MDIISELSKTFGSFRAENLGEDLFSFYTAPAYFPQLLNPIPCLLQGGRGTGKTTVLKSLSYSGQYTLHSENLEEFDKIPYIGVYYKLETGLVSAFLGANKDDTFWQQIFANFINIQICKEICDFTVWYESKLKEELEFDPHLLQAFCISLGIEEKKDIKSIGNMLDLEIAKLESNVNNASDENEIRKSAIGSPIRRLVKLLRNTKQLKGKTFFILLDEYENLRQYQQTIFNTLIKQADNELTFKIGIRELGLKTRHTLNPQEQLVDPSDLVLIDISRDLGENEFEKFASNVLENRFNEIRTRLPDMPLTVAELFEELSEDEEAVLLGGEVIANEVIHLLKLGLDIKETGKISSFNTRDFILMKFLISENSANEVDELISIYRKALSDPSSWRNKINNYGYASLFSLKRRKVGISKYYCGWKTFIMLASGNIRYLLQLVTNSLIAHAKDEKALNQKISAKLQTIVASEVGQKNLLELEGLSTQGAQLMKLVLSIGQVFHEMAIQGEGHAPEVTQFEIPVERASEVKKEQVKELIESAVMHLAIIRSQGTKLNGIGDTRDFDYMLHPIFAPFFVYSHRKKRKIVITPEELLNLIEIPHKGIKHLLSKQHRSTENEISDQLKLFGGFYEGNL